MVLSFSTYRLVARLVIALTGVAGVVLVVLAARHGDGLALGLAVALAVVLLVGAAVAALGLSTWSGLKAFGTAAPRLVRDNSYGLISGLRPRPSAEPGLTEWLHGIIQELAGRSDPGLDETSRRRPVTYGELAAAEVRLVTMTTNITQGTSLAFPLTTGGWAFHPEELRPLLPPDVLQHLVDCSPAVTDEARARVMAELGLLALPETADLPVILGARISLSFPLLISAIPLHTWAPTGRRPDGRWEVGFTRCWFSDGGITSNLPVHLFDRPVPTHPTYAINLSDGGDADQPPESNIYRPRDSRQGRVLPATPVDGPGSFLGSVLSTMQNWSDNALIRTVGHRERVCTVRLAPGQGGMNLDMARETIEALAEVGAAAGRELAAIQRSVEPPPPGAPEREPAWPVGHQWEAQRFTRLRAFYSGLGHYLKDAKVALDADLSPSYDELSLSAKERPWLDYSSNWSRLRAQRAADLLAGADDETLDGITDPPPAGARLSVSTFDRPAD